MKISIKAVLLVACLGLGLSAWPRGAAALDTQNFEISNFTADYYLSRESNNTANLYTVESITAQFPTYDQNHGILRAIPETYLGHSVSLQIDMVSDDHGNLYQYTTSKDSGNLVLKIGDANTYVHGNKVYNIAYEQKDVVSILPDHDEFYWDVNGDQWRQPFTHVTAKLHVPSDLANAFQSREACYVGKSGSKDTSRCGVSDDTESGGLVRTFTADSLGAGENMSIVNGFSNGTFKLSPQIVQAEKNQHLRHILYAVGTLGFPTLVGLYLYSCWWRYGRDPKGRGVIIPEYQPYKGLDVLSSSYIQLEKLNHKAISASVIELAVKGYLSIHETTQVKRLAKDKTGYSIKLEKDPTGLPIDQHAVVSMFFNVNQSVGTEVELASLKYTLATRVKALQKTLGKSLADAGFFKRNPETTAKTYYTIAGFLGFAGFCFAFTGLLILIGISLFLTVGVILVFARYIPSRTDKGVEVRDHMLGLRDYIKLAEADRINFLQSPKGAEKIQEAGLDPKDPKFKVKLFESLLPYAMVFSLEKNWAKQFDDVYKASPDWYNGNLNNLSAIYLATALNSFSAASAASFSPPSASASSGFGGGGFSGGGGGGGGGGGW